MSDITIFKLEELGIDLFENHTIKVKAKKNDAVSSFSNELSYTEIPHYDVTVYNDYPGSTIHLYDRVGNDDIDRGTVTYQETKTVPITQGQIYSGATYSTFSNPTTGETGNPFTISSDITLNLIRVPKKGNIITLDGGSARYRVLGVSGSEALLLAMDDYTTSAYNSSSVTKTFDGGKTGQKYGGSTLDNLLNTTYYNSLSSNVKSAIVDQTRIQMMYSFKNPDDPSYDYHQQLNFNVGNMRGLQIEDQTTVGSRHVFVLDIKDIFDYLGKDTMTCADLNDMFFEQTTAISKYIWLSSAHSVDSDYAFDVDGNGGFVNGNKYDSSRTVRPAFQVDLSKVSWVKVKE